MGGRIRTNTEVSTDGIQMRIAPDDKVLVLGSCFAANMGARLLGQGQDVCVNPFGTLFNPASVASSLSRLESGVPFVREDCVQMGAGSDLWCSFSHYTKFAKPQPEEFLAGANAALEASSAFFRSCSKVIVTFGTAYVFRHRERGVIVSNCLKRPACEFERYRLGVDEIVGLWRPLLSDGGPLAEKDVLFTVSPIRHLSDTAHGNTLSKASLLLAVERLLGESCGRGVRAYFPSYEIVLDELRDYSWYADDLVHPSEEAIDHIWEKFKKSILI